MTTSLRLRRGTTTQHSTFTGGAGEITVDTSKNTVVVHDGATAGGFPLAKASDVTGAVRYDSVQSLLAAQQLQVRSNIGAMAEPANTGLISKTGSGTTASRTIQAGSGISVTNGDGVNGNPSIANTGVLSVNGLTGAVNLNLTESQGGRGQVFTSSGTWTVPAGTTNAMVVCFGGGGGGGNATVSSTVGGGGGGGGMALKFVSGLTPGQQVAITVGAAGGSGASGGTSSFGAYCTATGGAAGGSNINQSTYGGGGAGGSGTGDFVVAGTAGSNAGTSGSYNYAGNGGNSNGAFMVSGTPGVGYAPGNNTNGGAASGYSSGGGGASRAAVGSTSYYGGAGGPGIVFVMW